MLTQTTSAVVLENSEYSDMETIQQVLDGNTAMFELGDGVIGMAERQRGDESREARRMRSNELGHRVVGEPGEVARRPAIGVDRLDGRGRQRHDLTVVGAELLEHSESDVEIVEERDVQPALDGAAVDDDLLQPIEERPGEDVIEDVDFERHRGELCLEVGRPLIRTLGVGVRAYPTPSVH